MAYDFFPKSADEIKSKLKNYQKDNLQEVVNLFNTLKKYDPTPINIDASKKSNINVSRKLQGKVDLKKIQRDLKLRTLTLKFGNGSSGNRGSNNRGNAFETTFLRDIKLWWEGNEKKCDPKNLVAIKDLDRIYKLSSSKKLDVISVGGKNTKRPLVFGESGITLLNPKGGNYDVGEAVSDITLKGDFGEVYLSLKLGNTTTFFNVGVRTILPPEDIKERKLRNSSGKRLLKMFGINESKFCDIFNGDASGSVDTKAKVDVNAISRLLQSGIGYGYHVIHQMSKGVLSKQMTKEKMKSASTIGNVTVSYGGVGGEGKRIDITFSSPDYSFKLNLRDTQGKDGYPTRLMCDFTYNH